MEDFYIWGRNLNTKDTESTETHKEVSLAPRVNVLRWSYLKSKFVHSHNSSCAFVLSVLFVLKCASWARLWSLELAGDAARMAALLDWV